MNDAPESAHVTASVVKQVRLIGTQERPNDALFELTTNEGKGYYLVPKQALPALAEKLVAVASNDSSAKSGPVDATGGSNSGSDDTK